jgi:predicted nucleic acid-binding Zn ribbon protein
MKQVFGKALLDFHGSGFYKTDYQKKSKSGD